MLGILFVLMIFVACGEDNPVASPDELIGTWRGVSAPDEILTFNADGTFTHRFTIDVIVITSTGTYTVESNLVTLRGNLTSTGGDLPEGTPDTIETTWQFSFSGSQLRLNFGAGAEELYDKQ
jgi:hypothetical protein